MRKGLFASLALQNIRKNSKFFYPYILTIICTVASFYIMCAIATDEGVSKLRGAEYVSFMMVMGLFIAGIFAVLLLLYTNSFLMKRRHKELALYNILGMEKRHIAGILCYESIYVALLGIIGGLLAGILFHKLVTLALFRLLRFEVPFGFMVSITAIKIAVILFSSIIALTLLLNLRRISKANPIELLQSSSAGEREPKSKWLLTIIGLISLGAGYYIALSTKSAMKALGLYFIAVFLVMIGTYCLFTAISIVILKLLRKNKKLFYNTKNFIGISGMLYRMKQNAVGLANICILSTMVLVMVSGTLSLYLGSEDLLNKLYPGQIIPQVVLKNETENEFQRDRMVEEITEVLSRNNETIKRFDDYTYLAFAVGQGDGYYHSNIEQGFNVDYVQLCFITAEDYTRVSGSVVELKEDEILFFSESLNKLENVTIELGGESYDFTIKERLSGFPSLANMNSYMVDTGFIVVKDKIVLQRIYKSQRLAYKGMASNLKWAAVIDINQKEEVQIRYAEEISSISSVDGIGDYHSFRVDTRAQYETETYAMTGGFLFLGLFLGFLFIMATVLIIYYKQISEGYEDKGRFEIMQKVGLPKKEIKRSINMQILIVFFAPLIVAAIHVAFDFRLMLKLLTLFALTNVKLTMLCNLGTLLGFAVIYGIVYVLTARTYYRIVSSK